MMASFQPDLLRIYWWANIIYIIYIYIYIYDKELFLCYTFPRYKRLTNLVQFFLLTVGVYVSLVFVCVCVCEV